MSKSFTPETDANSICDPDTTPFAPWVYSDFARDLESERNDARRVARYFYEQLRKKLMEKVELDLHESWEERSPWLFEEESK